MEVLTKLFGSAARVKIIRLFLFNPGVFYDKGDIQTKSKVTPTVTRKEISILVSVGFLRPKVFFKEVRKTKGKKTIIKKVKTNGWELDTNFSHIPSLRSLLLDFQSIDKNALALSFRKVGKINLLVIAGVFLNDPSSRIDLLLVGDRMKKGVFEGIVRQLESEIGKDLSYALFETADFKYRLGMYDKFVRDILDFPHEQLVDKLNLK